MRNAPAIYLLTETVDRAFVANLSEYGVRVILASNPEYVLKHWEGSGASLLVIQGENPLETANFIRERFQRSPRVIPILCCGGEPPDDNKRMIWHFRDFENPWKLTQKVLRLIKFLAAKKDKERRKDIRKLEKLLDI